jgi:hypothetical protein
MYDTLCSHDALCCSRLSHQVFASPCLVWIRKVINNQILHMNTIIQLCFAWKLLIQYCLLGWTPFVNVYTSTTTATYWHWIGFSCLFNGSVRCWLDGIIPLLTATSLVWMDWTNACNDMHGGGQVGKGFNQFAGVKGRGHWSSSFVEREILRIFWSLLSL